MKTPEGYVPGFDTNARPKKRTHWWNKPWTERGTTDLKLSSPIGVPAMRLIMGDEALQAGEDIDA